MRWLLALCVLVAFDGSALADWEDGRVPEGANAFTLGRHQLRLDVIGRSAFGLSDSVELETYLPLDAVLFPNLGVKARVVDDGDFAAAIDLEVGGGAYPLVGGALLPLPGALVGGGAIGFVVGSFQLLGTELSWQPARNVTLSLRANAIAVEASTVDLVGGAGAGGGDAAVTAQVVSFGGSSVGASGGAEVDVVLDAHDALIAEGDVIGFHGESEGMMLAWLGWTHAWERFHLTVGAYMIVDLPDGTMLHDDLPVAPFANVYWTFR